MDPNQITYFGETDARNRKIKFGIKAKDRLRHVYVIGKTGMGKSTLLENMAIQDIQNGNGIAFIDPHGGTAEKLLEYVPKERVKDVLYFAPFDLEYPVSFNIMEDVGADRRHLVVAGLMATFEKIWADAWSARMAYILQNTIAALLEYPGATLLGVNRMYTDKDFRKKVIDNIKDVAVRAFWVDEYSKYTDRYTQEATPAIQNKIGQFAANPLVRNIIGQSKSSFDIRKFMDEKKILIINLSKGRVGDGNARLLGSMLITKIYLAAMSRADMAEPELAKAPNFYLYVDEFQSFANKSFADILSEARKYKLNLTIAHQYIEQMEEEVRNAVFGNVGTMITYRVGAYDAEVLEKEFAPQFSATDLVNLGLYQMYLKLMIDGVSSAPFSATGMAPITRPDINFKNDVVESSRSQFAMPRVQVEKNIVEWHEAGTGREAKPIPSLNGDEGTHFEKPSQDRPAPAFNNSNHRNGDRPRNNEAPKVDENKLAFLKAAEELKQKEQEIRPEDSAVTLASMANAAKREENKKETVSLSQLEKNKKNPSKENMSSLKEALSSVINNAKKVEEKPQVEQNNSHTTPKEATPAEKPEIKQPEKEEKKEEPKQEPRAEHKTEHKDEKKPHKDTPPAGSPRTPREVPEDVLRSILSMEDSK